MSTNQIEQIDHPHFSRVTTCEEDEEQSKTVEEDELKQEDNAKEPVQSLHFRLIMVIFVIGQEDLTNC